MEERTIYIRDLIMRCLLKWRIALLCMILGACALSAFGVYRQNKANETASTSESTGQDEERAFETALEEAKAELTDAQIKEVDLAKNRYIALQRNYNELYDYYFGSVIGQIDTTAVNTVLLSYHIDMHHEVVFPQISKTNNTETVFAYITGNFVDRDFCRQISQIIGQDLEEQYITQLISAWKNGNILFVSVKGRNEDECNRMAELAKERVLSLTNKAKEEIADFDVTFLESIYKLAPDSGFMDNQFNQFNRMYTYQNAMNSILGYMNEDQRALLKTLTLHQLEQEKAEKSSEIEETVEEEEPAAEPEIEKEIKYILPKYIVAGAILGLFFVGGYVILYVLLAGRMLTQDDIRDTLKLSRLGTWTAGKQPKGIDRWIIRMFGGDGVQFGADESRSMSSAGIRIVAEKNGYKNLYFTGTANDEVCRAEVEKIAGAVAAEGLAVRSGRSILYDLESLEAMSTSDAVVLIEKIDESKNNEIAEEVRICNRQQMPILGYIALR